jgi:sugar phosphate isomerase/epimerase
VRSALCSVSFRDRTAEEVVQLADEAGIAGIEWGADVHLPPGDELALRRVRRASAVAGLEIAAYGSYLKLGEGLDQLDAVLDTACAVGAQLVRVWTGTVHARVVDEAHAAVEKAAALGLHLGCEHHGGTWTDSAARTATLMQEVPGLRTLWQPLPGMTAAERVAAVRLLEPWLVHVHVFNWTDEFERLPLAHALPEWSGYLAAAAPSGARFAALEFVPDDSAESLMQEAQALHQLLDGLRA